IVQWNWFRKHHLW
ncbi:hypothetical protein D039_4372B, partial [Vibrio parahaemolyticus EKP-028]